MTSPREVTRMRIRRVLKHWMLLQNLAGGTGLSPFRLKVPKGGLCMRCFACGVGYGPESKTCPICGRDLETDPDRYFRAGMDAISAGDIEEGVSLLEDCSRLDPNHLSARFNLGVAYSLGGRHDLAVRELFAVAQKDPEYPGLLTALGQVAFGMYTHHIEQAEAHKEQMLGFLLAAIRLDPEDVDALVTLGNVYIELGLPADALRYLERAAVIVPESPVVYFAMARALEMLGRRRQAALMAKKYLALAPPNDRFKSEVENFMHNLLQGTRATADG